MEKKAKKTCVYMRGRKLYKDPGMNQSVVLSGPCVQMCIENRPTVETN